MHRPFNFDDSTCKLREFIDADIRQACGFRHLEIGFRVRPRDLRILARSIVIALNHGSLGDGGVSQDATNLRASSIAAKVFLSCSSRRWNQSVLQIRWIFHPRSLRTCSRSRSRSRAERRNVGRPVALDPEQVAAGLVRIDDRQVDDEAGRPHLAVDLVAEPLQRRATCLSKSES